MIDGLPPPKPGLWMPEKPAIIRPAEKRLLRPMSLMPVFSPVVGAAPAPELTGAYVTSGADGAALSIGAEPGTGERRYIVVTSGTGNIVASRTPNNIGSPTIGGVSATIVEQAFFGDFISFAYFYAEVPTGTTAVIDSDWDSVPDNDQVSVYRLKVNNSGVLSLTDSDTSESNPATFSINVAAGGFVVGGVHTQNGDAYDWTNLTSNIDLDLNTNEWYGSASDSFVSEQTGLSITADPDTGVDDIMGIVASFAAVKP